MEKTYEGQHGWLGSYLFHRNPREIDLPFAHFHRTFRLRGNYRLHGFTSMLMRSLKVLWRVRRPVFCVAAHQTGRKARQVCRPREPCINLEQVPVVKEEALHFLPASGVFGSRANAVEASQLGLKAGKKVWAPRRPSHEQ